MSDIYTEHDGFKVCWRTISEEKRIAVYVLQGSRWKFVSAWPLGPVPLSELEAALKAAVLP